LFVTIITAFAFPASGRAMTCGAENSSGKKVLVAYDTKHGSTVTVVNKISEVLCAQGLQVDVILAEEVGEISGYDAAVVGSPLYWATYLPGAMKFMEKNRDALASIPVALFFLSTTVDKETGLVADNALELFFTPVLQEFPEIKPVGTIGQFGGEIEFKTTNPHEFINLNFSGYGEECNYLNYDVIGSWASDIAEHIK